MGALTVSGFSGMAAGASKRMDRLQHAFHWQLKIPLAANQKAKSQLGLTELPSN